MALGIILCIQWLSIFVLALESAYIFFNWKTRGQSYLFVYCMAALINNVGYLMIMTIGGGQVMDAESASVTALMAAKFCYLGKTWIPISFFAMVMEICEFRIQKKVYAILVTVHMLIFLVVLSNDYHHLYYTDIKWINDGLFSHNVYGHGLLYSSYTVLLFLYIIFGTIVLIRRYVNDKDASSRKLYRNLFIAIFAMSGGLVAYYARITGGYDATVLGYAVTAVVLFFAIFKQHLMDTLTLVRDYAIDNLSEGIIATDRRGRVIYHNSPMEAIYGNVDTEAECVINEVAAHLESGDVIHKEDHIYEPSCNPLYRGDAISGKLYVLSDVTARYRHMEELQEQKEIAEEANESKSAFLSVVTHEIRTPMNAVIGMTELLLRESDELNSKQEKYLRNIKNSGEALVMIVNDILDQSKIEAGRMEIVEDAYEIRPMAEDVKMIIENRIGSRPVRLIYEIDDDVPQFLVGDSLRIRQILINLMNNAVKFTEAGYIRLGIDVTEVDKGRRLLKFSIKDSGQGIMPEDLSKLGEAFVQVDVKRNHSKEGTGLGLSISRDFISMMGGQLEVASEYGKGSEFYFSIWQGVAAGIDLRSHTGLNRQPWQQDEKFVAPDARILIVDDSDLNLMIARELLKPVNMMAIDTVKSGEQAIDIVKKNRYDIIFMDYMMPYMDGVETTEKIRRETDNPDNDEKFREYIRTVPIVALSGDDSEAAKDKFFRAGINDFIEKPVNPQKLKKMLIKWLPGEMIRPAEQQGT